MMVDVSIVPVSDESKSSITSAIEEIENSGIRFRKTPMGTVVEIKNFEELGRLLDKISKRFSKQNSPKVHICCQSLL